MDQLWRRNRIQSHLLTLCVDPLRAYEGFQLDRLPAFERGENAFQHTYIGKALFAVRLWVFVVENALGEILEFAAEVVGILERLLLFLFANCDDALQSLAEDIRRIQLQDALCAKCN